MLPLLMTTALANRRISVAALAISFGTVTTTLDGSPGSVYSAPAGMSGPFQWYSEVQTAAKPRTMIAGATSATYTATDAEASAAGQPDNRIVVVGMLGGKLTLARPLRVCKRRPLPLELFEVNTGYANTGAPVTSLNSTDKVQGTNCLEIQPVGAGYRIVKTIGTLTSLGMSTTAELGTVSYMADQPDPLGCWDIGNGTMRIAQTATTPGFAATLGIAGFGRVSKGKTWYSQPVSENATIGAMDPSLSWRFDYDKASVASAPYISKFRLDSFLARSEGRATCSISMDDAYGTQIAAWDDLVARGIPATFFFPTDIVAAGNGSSRIGVSNAQSMKALWPEGFDAQVDGTPDDNIMSVKYATPADAVAGLLAQRAQLAAWGLNNNARFFCYPNGGSWVNPLDPTNGEQADYRAVTNVTFTANGTNVVTASSATGIAIGQTVSGYGNSTRIGGRGVLTVTNVSGTSITLSSALATGTYVCALWDDSHPFMLTKLQDALIADGTFKLGRTNYQDTFYSRFGFGDRGLLIPSVSISNGANGTFTGAQLAANALAFVDKAIARGANVTFYIHGIFDGATFINTPRTNTWIPVIDGIAARRDAGMLDPFNFNQMYERDYNAAVPL